MKRILLMAVTILGLSAPAGALTVETAYARHYASDQIRPIGQFFGSKLSPQGFRAVVPSQAGNPEGQYFIIKLEDWKDAGIASARITLFATDNKESVIREWDLNGVSLKRWLYLGLTGSDWPDEAVRALAWHIEMLDANGAVLAEWKSFLWEMP